MTIARTLALAALAVACSEQAAPRDPAHSQRRSAPALEDHAPEGIAPATSVRLPAAVAPTSYRLDLSIDPAKPVFRGRVEIDLRIEGDTRDIVLHGKELRVEKAQLVTDHETLSLSPTPRAAFGAREGMDELVLRGDRIFARGTATLKLEYEAKFGSLSGIYAVNEGGRAYAFSQMEPDDARRAFPCFDEPAFKTPFELVLHVPAGMTAVANTKEIGRESEGATTKISFAKTAPLPTYLFAVAVGDLELLDGPAGAATPVRFVAPHGRARLGKATAEAAAASLSALERYFEVPYAYGKLDIASVPNFGAGAMENAGLVTFRQELVEIDDTTPANLRRRMQIIMAHELAHQWFGNLVTIAWWDDLWLNEGFATWMAPKIADEAFPGFDGRAERVIESSYAMNADALPSAAAVRPRVETSGDVREAGGWTAYSKGAAILTMLESWIGEAEMRRALARYVRDNAHGSVTSKRLFAAFDATEKLPVSKVAASLLDQPGAPLVRATVDCDARRVTLVASDAGGAKRKFIFPVCLSIEGTKAPCVVVDGDAPAVVDLPPKKKSGESCPWVFPDADEAGYFRYELDAAATKRLVASFGSLRETERAGLLLNAWALVLLGRAPPSFVVDLLSRAGATRETSRVVVLAMTNVLGELDRVFVDDKSRPAFSRFVIKLLDPHKKRLGMPAKGEADAVRTLRVEVLATLHDLADDASVLSMLEPIAKKYLADPKAADPDLAPLAVRASMRAGGVAKDGLDAARLARAASADERVTLVGALASARDPAALRAALSLFANGTIRGGDFRHVRNAALRHPDTARVFYAFVREHFDELLARVPYAGAWTGTIGATCDAAELERFAAFFEPRLEKLEAAERGFREGVAEAKRCIALRAQGGPRF